MINVQGAVFKLAHCLSGRAQGEQEAAGPPACRNFVVCLVAMVQLCMFCSPPLVFPFSTLSFSPPLPRRLLWMW